VVSFLRANGLQLDPVSAFAIGGGVGFMYAVFSYKEVPHPLLTLVCLARMLDAGRAVILPVARQSVPWLHADALTAHEERVVLALPEGDEVRIVDGTGGHATMSGSALREAYADTARKHPVLAIADGATMPDDLGPAVTRGLRATVSGMTEPVLGNSFDVNFGLSGLRRWSERVTARGADGWGRAFPDADVWRRRLVECIDVEYTAPTAGRPLFARVLRQYGHEGAATQVEASGVHWRAIADGARRGTLDLSALASRVNGIVREETAAMAILGPQARGRGAVGVGDEASTVLD
jgi:hypothetical protein